MIFHYHPYLPILNDDTKILIIGTLPPPRFCTKELKIKDVDFPYGSKDSLFWQILDKIFKLNLIYNNSLEAINQRKNFLIKNKIGICDIVENCKRIKYDASDLTMQDIVLRDILYYLKNYKNIYKIIFTGGNSKNSPEYFFRKILKQNNIKIEIIDKDTPKINKFTFDNRSFTTISLTSPSNSANKSIGSNNHYKQKKEKDDKYTTFDFRVEQYKKVFRNFE
jgi:hypoxanthine-DNA glycosylase